MVKLNKEIVVEKAKVHFKANKKAYIIGGVSFVTGSIITYFLARPQIGTLNVYHMNEPTVINTGDKGIFDKKKYRGFSDAKPTQNQSFRH